MKIDEQTLTSRMLCGIADFEQEAFWNCVRSVTSGIVSDAAGMLLPELKAIRDRFSFAWESVGVSDSARVDGHKKLPAIAHRVVTLIRDYQILLPVARYEVILPAGVILVDYAIARPWRSDSTPVCLNLIRSKAPASYRYPDAVSLARWTHLARRERGREIKLLNVPVMNGQSWITKNLSLPLVEKQLNTILEGVQKDHRFARPGSHCESCQSHRCQELIYDRRSNGDQASSAKDGSCPY